MLKKPPVGATIILVVALGEPWPTKYVEIFPKLEIQWDSPMVLGLIIQNKKVRTTNPAVRAQVTVGTDKKEGIIGCHYFQVEPRVGFAKLLFTTAPVPDGYLDVVTADIERLNTLIKS